MKTINCLKTFLAVNKINNSKILIFLNYSTAKSNFGQAKNDSCGFKIIDSYKNLVDNKLINYDPRQYDIVLKLNDFYIKLLNKNQN